MPTELNGCEVLALICLCHAKVTVNVHAFPAPRTIRE